MNTLTEDFKEDHEKAIYVWPLFFSRRLIFAFSIVLGNEVLPLQIAVNLIFAIGLFAAQFRFKVFKIDVQNLLELFNEGNNILMLILMAIMATRDRDNQNTMGWLLLCSIIITMIINLGKGF